MVDNKNYDHLKGQDKKFDHTQKAGQKEEKLGSQKSGSSFGEKNTDNLKKGGEHQKGSIDKEGKKGGDAGWSKR